MLFEETFLDKADLQKYQLYRVIKTLSTETFTITDLSQEIELTYRQTYNIFQDLQNDLESLPDLENRLTSHLEMKLSSFPLSLDKYRLYLLKNSTVFQFMNALAIGPRESLEQFCANHFTSRSTLLRKTTNLKNLLAHYQIKISYTTMKLVGMEQAIRLFLYNFYWLSYHAVAWPFKHQNFKEIQKWYLQLPEAADNLISILQECQFTAICRIRIASGHVISVSDSTRFNQLFDQFSAFQKPVYAQKDFPKLTSEQLTAETQFFHYFQNRSVHFSADWRSTPQPLYRYFKK